MALEKIESYSDSGRAYILEQYKGSSKLLGLIDAILTQCDSLEDALFEVRNSLNLDDAVGVAIDYIGALIGVTRRPGESDDAYRERVRIGNPLNGLPAPEALRSLLKLLTGCDKVGIYPCHPAGAYFVLGGSTEADLSSVQRYMTSGAELARGTYLCMEEGDLLEGYLCDEDNQQPLISSYILPENIYDLVNESDEELVDSEGETLIALDF